MGCINLLGILPCFRRGAETSGLAVPNEAWERLHFLGSFVVALKLIVSDDQISECVCMRRVISI